LYVRLAIAEDNGPVSDKVHAPYCNQPEGY
jgi:hypothetical protein